MYSSCNLITYYYFLNFFKYIFIGHTCISSLYVSVNWLGTFTLPTRLEGVDQMVVGHDSFPGVLRE